MYGLSAQDLQIQARARTFADELIPYEVTAELNGGELPKDVVAAHAARARELGLHSANMPESLGGGGCTSLQQVLIQEQAGRVTRIPRTRSSSAAARSARGVPISCAAAVLTA